MTLISVCMPVFNDAENVASAVASILRQTHRTLQFIIIDDCSTDRTPDVLDSIEDSRVQIRRQPVNSGNLACRNLAFDLAEGDVIALMDSDDMADPRRLELQLKAMRDGVELCGAHAIRGSDPAGPDRLWAPPVSQAELEISALFGSPMPNPSVMLSRAFLERAPFRFDEAFFPAADYHAWAVALVIERTPIRIVPRPLVFRRMRRQSISSSFAEQQHAMADKVRQLLFDHYGVDAPDAITLHNAFVEGRRTFSSDEVDALSALYFDVLATLRPEPYASDIGRRFLEAKLRLIETEAEPFIAPPAPKTAPDISVVMPVYNVADYVADAIDSVLRQDDVDWELIIVNDGSTDDTREVVERYAADPRLRVVDQENKGLSEARNTGVATAAGRYVFFLDGDDLLTPGALRRLLASAESANAEVVVGAHDAFTPDGARSARYRPNLGRSHHSKHIFFLSALRAFGHPAWNKLIARAHALEIPFKPGLYHEDELFCPELFVRARRVATVNHVTYLYRQRIGSITNRVTTKHVEDWLTIIDRVLDLVDLHCATESEQLGAVSLLKSLDWSLNDKIDRCGVEDAALQTRITETRARVESALFGFSSGLFIRDRRAIAEQRKQLERACFAQAGGSASLGIGSSPKRFDEDALLASLPEFATRPAPPLTVEEPFDAREPFVGQNWFEPEEDGRWAGRGPSSTIVVRAIPPGSYTIRFTFMHFVDDRFVRKVRLAINGEPLRLQARYASGGPSSLVARLTSGRRDAVSYPVELVGPWRRGAGLDHMMDLITLHFPFAAAPNEQDQRLLTGRLRSIVLSR